MNAFYLGPMPNIVFAVYFRIIIVVVVAQLSALLSFAMQRCMAYAVLVVARCHSLLSGAPAVHCEFQFNSMCLCAHARGVIQLHI